MNIFDLLFCINRRTVYQYKSRLVNSINRYGKTLFMFKVRQKCISAKASQYFPFRLFVMIGLILLTSTSFYNICRFLKQLHCWYILQCDLRHENFFRAIAGLHSWPSWRSCVSPILVLV